MSFIDRALGMFSTDMGIDLGTANTVVCIRGKGVIMSEPSMVAVKKGTNIVVRDGNEEAVGNAARRMLGKVPGSIQVIRPLQQGAIADFDITQAMLRYFIRRVHGGRSFGVNPRVLIAIPSGGTEVERKAVVNSAEMAGARHVRLIEQPLASAIGAGLPVAMPTGSMICDIGGGTSEVAIISMGGIVCGTSVRTGGDVFDDAIIAYLKEKHNLLIGKMTAESIKINVGSVMALEEGELEMPVRGLDLIASLPKQLTIKSEEIRECLLSPVSNVLAAIMETLTRAPPEIAGDLVTQGIMLAGGSCQLRGLDALISQKTGLPAKRADDPLTCVARGTGILLEQYDLLSAILESGDRN